LPAYSLLFAQHPEDHGAHSESHQVDAKRHSPQPRVLQPVVASDGSPLLSVWDQVELPWSFFMLCLIKHRDTCVCFALMTFTSPCRIDKTVLCLDLHNGKGNPGQNMWKIYVTVKHIIIPISCNMKLKRDF